ncbi:hypothetical protein [Phenylobacterium sp.]|uniref:hypothetical protein n=1 Tax=Phenylobacterium sp. TaxID=1871053 RepID=UPI002730CFCA|nr:hypothetical protein [Phenylobacterium sp.]MDP2213163.1 hypothetical protein [Phenylobacterium sp.]
MSWLNLSTALAGLVGVGPCLHAWKSLGRAGLRDQRRLNLAGLVILAVVWLVMVPATLFLWRQGLEAPWVFGAETYDGGVVETATGLGLAAAALLALRQSVRSSDGLRTVFWGGISALAVLAFGEETSWGQHLFQWSATGVFATANLQAETNLHNFISPRLYDVAYAAVGWGIIAFAAAVSFRPRRLAGLHRYSPFPQPSPVGIALLVSGGVLIQHERFEELAEAVVIASFVFIQARQFLADRAIGLEQSAAMGPGGARNPA